MRYVQLGDTHVSVVGLGAWQLGSEGWGWGVDLDERGAEAIVRRSLDLGINLIDTAELYGHGRSEELIGKSVRHCRKDVIIATKVSPLRLTYRGVKRAAEGSLRRLGTDVIDLYQVHWPNPLFPLAWAMRGMADLVKEGKVRHVGVSNFSLSRWRRSDRALERAILSRTGPASVVISNQVQFNILQQWPLRGLLPFAQEHHRVIIAYSPMAQGLLSGTYTAANLPTNASRAKNPLFTPANVRRATPVIEALRDLAKHYDATPAHIAIAWTIKEPGVIAIPGARSAAQAEANARAADIRLSDGDWQLLTSLGHGFRQATGWRVGYLLWAFGYRLTR